MSKAEFLWSYLNCIRYIVYIVLCNLARMCARRASFAGDGEMFYSLLKAIGIDPESEDQFDIVGNLPEEIAVLILGYLPPASLASAMQVSRRWCGICHSDSRLRSTIKVHLRRERLGRVMPLGVSRALDNGNARSWRISGKEQIPVLPDSDLNSSHADTSSGSESSQSPLFLRQAKNYPESNSPPRKQGLRL
ncbi:uncharacterized protein LOC134530263 [Bacillus rossius redtenbacheri]|uniref:uncharacterized protein LOC134530263 n=1 Tax=Bacillus rossius redtenbacheri TaxID=93214 RepID=UPI002FDCD5C5